jgi:hypothetical protein
MNKPIAEWPASLMVAIFITAGCGFVLNSYWPAAADDLFDIGLPQIMIFVSVIVAIGIWFETFRSFKVYQLEKQTPSIPKEDEKMVWPDLPKDSKPLEPLGSIGKTYKIDE